jgi:hypothetical protein
MIGMTLPVLTGHPSFLPENLWECEYKVSCLFWFLELRLFRCLGHQSNWCHFLGIEGPQLVITYSFLTPDGFPDLVKVQMRGIADRILPRVLVPRNALCQILPRRR